MIWLLLALALAAVGYFVSTDSAEYARFKALETTRERQAQYRVWLIKSFAVFVGMSLIGLALIGRFDAIWNLPAEFGPAVARVPAIDLRGADAMVPFLILGGLLAGSVFGAVVASRKGKGAKAPMLGDVEPLMPRNGAEIAHGALLSINAGVSEELFFRLYLPLLLVLAGLAPVTAFILAAVIFGLVHLYQGWVGVLATMVLGAVLTIAYLASGTLAVPVVLHILIDLNGLVVRPLLARLLTRRTPG